MDREREGERKRDELTLVLKIFSFVFIYIYIQVPARDEDHSVLGVSGREEGATWFLVPVQPSHQGMLLLFTM